jgi:uracil-DNA glycosylase family 4
VAVVGCAEAGRYDARMADPASDRVRRFAAALVETDLLLGIDAVPVDATVDVDTDESTDTISVGTASPDARAERPARLAETRPPTPASPPPPKITVATELRSALPPDDKADGTNADRLAAIREHHAAHCPLCASGDANRSIVFGEGDPQASLVFVGEAPGEQEDQAGRPFVGPAGELLDKMIKALGLGREQVYITNVVKTRPFENRTPRPDEAAACGPWLADELLAIRPKAIVALGGTPAKHLLQTVTGITRLRGVWGACRIGDTEFRVMPTFHPAFVLRQYTPEVRSAVWQDLQAAKALVDG